MPPRTTKYKQRIILSETIRSYGSPSMPCSNCVRYQRRCVVLQHKSQRCGECVRRGVRCDAFQASVDDLQNLRLEEDRLKYERDTAFEAAMAGLTRVRELELRQQELRERGMEMLRRGLKTLDELDAEEEKERLDKKRPGEGAAEASTAGPSPSPNAVPSDPAFLSPSFWEGWDFDGGIPPTSQGSC